jgi:polar amino acid transport system substrate-binding protein
VALRAVRAGMRRPLARVYDAGTVGTAIRSRAAALIFVVALGVVGLALLVRGRGERRALPAVAPVAAAASAEALAARARPTPGTLAVAVEDDAGLWSLRDGSGYANDVVRAAFAAAGVVISLEVVPYARCKQMLLEGVVAACFSMSPAEDHDPQVALSAEPLFVCSSELVQRTADRRDFTDAAHVPRGVIVGTVLGYEYPDALYQLEREHVVELEPSASEDLNLKKLAQGRIDAAVVNINRTKPLGYMIARAGVTGRVRRGFTLGELAAYVGFSHKHARGDEAHARFDQGMEIIVADGTRERIERDWAARAEAASRPGGAPAAAVRSDGGTP